MVVKNCLTEEEGIWYDEPIQKQISEFSAAFSCSFGQVLLEFADYLLSL